jgi:LacI family transcriptional regulator, galactose operon repressor
MSTTGAGGGSRRITLDDVAAAAGVSPAAVSLALRGKAGVARATRQRIVDVAAVLGYHVRPVKGPPAEYTIGLLLAIRQAGPPERSHGPVVTAITAACADAGADVRLGTLALDDNDEPVTAPSLTRQAGVNGFLVLGPWLSRASASMFGRRPVVLIDGDAEDRDVFSTVVGDDAGGSADATFALVKQRHRRIVFAGASDDAPASILERRRGYAEAMRDSSLQPSYTNGSVDDPEGVAASLMSELRRRRRFTAVVAANDAVALAVLAAAIAARIRVPADLSITGFDDIEATRLVSPKLTTVTVNKEAMGRLATAMLLQRIDQPQDPPFTVLQRARLIPRESVAPPPGSGGDVRDSVAATVS